MTQELEQQLQRLHDGELSDADAEVLYEALSRSPSLQAKRAELEQLSIVFQNAYGNVGDEIDGSELFARIEAQLPSAKRAKIRHLHAGPRSTKSVVHWQPMVASFAALAAALFLAFWPHTTPHPASVSASTTAVVAPPTGSEIVDIDFGYSTGAVFSVEDDGARYAVVWISDEKVPTETMQ